MKWKEFRDWCWETYRYHVNDRGKGLSRSTIWSVVNQLYGVNRWDARNGKGSGNNAVYGTREQRRFAAWLRCHELISVHVMNDWLTASEQHDDGWLINDGSGIRWLADPASEAHELVNKGFVAVKCGL